MLIKNISMGESESFFNVNVACLTGVQRGEEGETEQLY